MPVPFKSDRPSARNPHFPWLAFEIASNRRRLNHVDDDQRDVVLLGQRRRLPKPYLGEQLVR